MPQCLVITIRCDMPAGVDSDKFQDEVVSHVRDVFAEKGIAPGHSADAFEIETSVEAPRVRWYLITGPTDLRQTTNMFQRTVSHEELAKWAGLRSSNPIVYQVPRPPTPEGSRYRFLLPGETLTPHTGETISVLHLD